jgi:predicted phage-related endonuclease
MNTPTLSKPPARTRPIGIGGTDIGAILSLSPYKTPLELWSELVSGDIPANRDLLHLRYGQHTESFVASEYERCSNLFTVKHEPTLFHKDHGYMFGHIDRFVSDTPDTPAVICLTSTILTARRQLFWPVEAGNELNSLFT